MIGVAEAAERIRVDASSRTNNIDQVVRMANMDDLTLVATTLLCLNAVMTLFSPDEFSSLCRLPDVDAAVKDILTNEPAIREQFQADLAQLNARVSSEGLGEGCSNK